MHPRIAWTIAILYTLLLSYLLLVPHPLDFFGTAGKQAEEDIDRAVSAYLQHIVAYAGLACLLGWALWTVADGKRVLLLPLAAGAVHALGTEWLQIRVPHRYGDWPDALANLGGIAAGGLMLWLAGSTRPHPTSRQTPHKSRSEGPHRVFPATRLKRP